MGKRAEQAKKRKRQAPALPAAGAGAAGAVPGAKRAAHDLPTPPAEALLLPEEVESAVDVLRVLAANPSLLHGREMKDVKRSVYDLHRVLAEGATLGASLTSRISAALRDYRFTDALVLLFEMHARALPPKLGALQRWVRECDATSNPDGSPGDPEALRCLDMILRIAGDTGPEARTRGEGEVSRALVKRPRVWAARGPVDGEIALWPLMRAGTLFDGAPAPRTLPYPGFRSVHFVRAHERRPPNLYDSTVWGSEPGAIRLTPAAQRRKPARIDVPGLPGAFLVLDVFTPDECLQIVRAATAHGWEKDQAAEGSATQKNSILARNFVWLADEQVHDHFFAQIRDFVPQRAPDEHGRLGHGGNVRGINRRFRTYQYTENQLYRVSPAERSGPRAAWRPQPLRTLSNAPMRCPS